MSREREPQEDTAAIEEPIGPIESDSPGAAPR